MSKRAEELAKRLYPDPKLEDYDDILVYRADRDNVLLGMINVVRVYEQAEKNTIERIISYLGECDLEHTILDFDRDGYANIHFESLEKLIRKAMEDE